MSSGVFAHNHLSGIDRQIHNACGEPSRSLCTNPIGVQSAHLYIDSNNAGPGLPLNSNNGCVTYAAAYLALTRKRMMKKWTLTRFGALG